MSSVLDASALLAYVLDEPGAERVLAALRAGAVVAAVNWAETLARLAELGADPASEAVRLRTLLDGALRIAPLDEVQCVEIARLRPTTRPLGLSLGDRACLALGSALGLPVLTADRSWTGLGIGVRVELVR
ncbi:MAG TPA: type II toxin-antitoxin system VapC family toxin [Chloroflexota bacterium]|nr:type II toxin-antitoxin system VapC family toxin [Chloroflexota bacterium]